MASVAGAAVGSIAERMAELRTACEREIRTQREAATLAAASFRRSLQSLRSDAEETLASREKLAGLKDELKELEADMAEALTVKTCKESKRKAIAEALSATATSSQHLKKIVADQRARRDEYAAVISNQLLAMSTLEERVNQSAIERVNLEEALMWYNKVLGFRAVGGEGVKFIFNKISSKNLDEEYSFTIRVDNDKYSLLQCNPYIDGVSELIEDLNRTNDLYKFVRIMRTKFRALSLNGLIPTASSVHPGSSSLTVSSPPPVSVDSTSERTVGQNYPGAQAKDNPGAPKALVHCQPAIYPQVLSSARRSPRLAGMRLPRAT